MTNVPGLQWAGKISGRLLFFNSRSSDIYVYLIKSASVDRLLPVVWGDEQKYWKKMLARSDTCSMKEWKQECSISLSTESDRRRTWYSVFKLSPPFHNPFEDWSFFFVWCLEIIIRNVKPRAPCVHTVPLAWCFQFSGPTLPCHIDSLITTKYYFKAALTAIRSNWVLSTNTNCGFSNLDFSWYFNEVCVNNPKSSVSPAAESHTQTSDGGTMC